MLFRRVLILGLPPLIVMIAAALVWQHQQRVARAKEANQTIEERLYAQLAREALFTPPDGSYQLFVGGVQGKTLLKPLLKHKNARGQIDQVIRSQEGELSVRPREKQLLLHMREGEIWNADGSEGWFADRVLKLDLPESVERH